MKRGLYLIVILSLLSRQIIYHVGCHVSRGQTGARGVSGRQIQDMLQLVSHSCSILGLIRKLVIVLDV